MKRLKKEVLLENISSYDLDGLLVDEWVSTLLHLKEKYPNFSNLKLEADSTEDGFQGLDLYGTRLENDQEFDLRVKTAKKAKERKKKEKEENLQVELMEYLRLKEKFNKQDCSTQEK